MSGHAPNGYSVDMQIENDNWGAILCPYGAGEETLMAVYESCHIIFTYSSIMS